MIDAWNALPLIQQIYWAIAVLATLVTLIQAVLTLVGLSDVPDLDLAENPSGIGLFSSQTVFAFLTGFGWSGLVCYAFGLPDLPTGIIAFLFGGGTMAAMYFFLVGLLSLQEQGNSDPETAVGVTGEVYIRIPGSGSGGIGQIQVIISGRLQTVDARTDNPEPLPAGTRIRVIRHLGANCFLVERATPSLSGADPAAPATAG